MLLGKKILLDDKYVKKTGRIYINGVRSIVRLSLIQKHRDLIKVKGYGSIRERNLNIFKENLQNAAINFTKI